jgi:drug/metabolite transporter (DMT)-like permease
VRVLPKLLPLIVLCGALDMSANILLLLAVRTGYITIASVLTGLYPASTVVLASLLLRERVQCVQRWGVVLALAGVALIAS